MAQRMAALDHLMVEFHWFECGAAYGADPLDRSKWRTDGLVQLRKYRAWIVRPWFRLRFSGQFGNERDTDSAWVDGEHVTRQLDDDDTWSVVRDRMERSVTGPLPVGTPLELHVFDFREPLLKLLDEGRIELVSADDTEVVLAGARPPPPAYPASVRAVLDPRRGMLPVEIRVEIEVPNGRGIITYTLRTLASTRVGGVHAIREAILSTTNTAVSRADRIVYHFLAHSIRVDPNLDADTLRVEIPAVNAKIIDEIDLFYRRLDATGKVVAEERWTAEERQHQLAALRETFARAQDADRTLLRRYRSFFLITGASAAVVLAVVGVWGWRRLRLRAT